jgi:chromosome segregation ATPase
MAKLRQETVRERPGSYVPYSSTLPPENRAETEELFRRMRGMERIIDNLQMEANLAKSSKTDMERELARLRRALAECQEHGRQLNSENQKTKIILDQTQALLTDTQRKAAANYIPTQRENLELNQQVRQLVAREMVLEREVAALTATVKALDRDKDEMRIELDRKDEKLARVQAENRQFQEQVDKLQMQNKDVELRLGHTGEASRDHEREIYQLRRQIDTLKADLDHRIRERDNAQKELNRVVQACSRTEVDKRSMAVELEKSGKESDELRRQLQKYIDEVRRIEELLYKKEEEMELLMENFQVLSHEKGQLETQRSILERESTSIRTDVLGASTALTTSDKSETIMSGDNFACVEFAPSHRHCQIQSEREISCDYPIQCENSGNNCYCPTQCEHSDYGYDYC